MMTMMMNHERNIKPCDDHYCQVSVTSTEL